MPEQRSTRALPVTTSPFEAPFATEIYPCGLGGLNLKDQLDAIPVGQFALHTNLIHTMDRGVTARDGLTALATGGTNHHSVRRLHDPQAGTDTRLWGTDQALRIGLTGAVSQIDTGYSGDPLTLVPHRPPLSGDPWMFVADRTRMRKVRADGLVVPIGLPAPGAAPVVSAGNLYTTSICAFDAGDATDAANWTIAPVGAVDADPPAPTGVGEVLNASGLQGTAVSFGLFLGTTVASYNTWFGIAKTIDLSKLQGGLGPTPTDDDLFHLWVNLSHPHLIDEMRIYLVCGGAFSPNYLPGTDHLGRNTDAYVKTFRQNDLAQAIQAKKTLVDAAETARIRDLRNQSLDDKATRQGWVSALKLTNLATNAVIAQRDPSRQVSVESGGGAEEWVEFGVVDVPVRRGDFQRIGSTAGADWSTVIGIIVYLSATGSNGPVAVRLDDCFLYGGAGLDSTAPGSQPYDFRVTNYDPRTGAESNPSPVMADANFRDFARREAFVQPAVYGDGAIRQRVYRRGGSLITDWYFAGVNTSDGGLFVDNATDDAITDAGTVNLDHYQPVPTVDDAGATVLNQAVPILFGPANGLLFALGDPHRPGHLYWCIPDEPDHWPAESNFEVCPPSEELMAGLMHGPQPFCFSRERLYAVYPSLSGDTEVTVTTTGCRRGLVGRWAWAVGKGGIYGVAKDGIFVTNGGAEEIVSLEIQPLFRGQTWNGYSPVDFTVPTAIRLSIYQDQLFFLYQGTDGNRHVLVGSILFKFWTAYEYGHPLSALTPDDDSPIAQLLCGGQTAGTTYLSSPTAFDDAGVAIACVLRTGDWDLGRPREDKLLGDQILDVDTQGVDLTLQNRLNNGTTTNPAQAVSGAAGRTRFVLDGFGTTPQRARTISTDLRWSSSTARPVVYFFGLATIPEPDLIVNRVTQWDDLGSPDESYVTGITFDADTGGGVVILYAERDFDGAMTTMATLTLQTTGRRKMKFSWADAVTGHGFPAHKVRIRPDTDCVPWILYRADWIHVAEPPRIARWDIHFEADGDQYYTGLDLYCDTNGLEKRIQIEVDGVALTNALAGLAYWPVTTTGRQWIHLTLPWGRGHVFHFHATDTNPGLLYKHKWYTDPEPSEQANWNQNFSVYGTLADKWFKACLFECDTFGIAKSVTVEVDGVVKETLSVQTTGRKVVHLAFTTQYLGRVLRIFPVDGNPSRPYTILPIFDVEPYSLTRWETQEGDDGVAGWKTWVSAYVTLVSTSDVTLTMSMQRSQGGDGSVQTCTYTIPSTNGVKLERFVPFQAAKGVKRKFVFSATSAFRLYREESTLIFVPWGSAEAVTSHPFGNDDEDASRGMVVASLAAARSGGSLQ